jgi:hypothetical protein
MTQLCSKGNMREYDYHSVHKEYSRSLRVGDVIIFVDVEMTNMPLKDKAGFLYINLNHGSENDMIKKIDDLFKKFARSRILVIAWAIFKCSRYKQLMFLGSFSSYVCDSLPSNQSPRYLPNSLLSAAHAKSEYAKYHAYEPLSSYKDKHCKVSEEVRIDAGRPIKEIMEHLRWTISKYDIVAIISHRLDFDLGVLIHEAFLLGDIELVTELQNMLHYDTILGDSYQWIVGNVYNMNDSGLTLIDRTPPPLLFSSSMNWLIILDSFVYHDPLVDVFRAVELFIRKCVYFNMRLISESNLSSFEYFTNEMCRLGLYENITFPPNPSETTYLPPSYMLRPVFYKQCRRLDKNESITGVVVDRFYCRLSSPVIIYINDSDYLKLRLPTDYIHYVPRQEHARNIHPAINIMKTYRK